MTITVIDVNKLIEEAEKRPPRKPLKPSRMVKCPYCQGENYRITNATDESDSEWIGAYSIEGTAHCDDCGKDFQIYVFIDTLGDARTEKMEAKE